MTKGTRASLALVLSLLTAPTGGVELAATASVALPAPLNGTQSWIANGSIWTDDDTQHVVWVDDRRHGRIAVRDIDSADWDTVVDLATVAPTVFAELFADDSHNTIKVAVDAAGYVHVIGNHHNTPFNHMRSAVPGSLIEWVVVDGADGARGITYPQLFVDDDELYLFYRVGTNMGGDWMLNRWDPDTLTWTSVGVMLTGSDAGSAYPQDIAVDPDTGRWHMMWTVRYNGPPGEPGPERNRNIYAAYSDDHGATWRSHSDGSMGGELVVDHPGGTQLLMNNHHGLIALDDDGQPHSIWLMADESGALRSHHVWFDGASWRDEVLLPDTAHRGRPDAVAIDGSIWMIYVAPDGTLAAVDAGSGERVALSDGRDLNVYEPVIDSTVDALYMLVAPERAPELGSQVGELLSAD